MSAFVRGVLVFLFITVSIQATASVNVQSFDSSIVINEAAIEASVAQGMDSMLRNHPMLSSELKVLREYMHPYDDKTFDFYVLLALLAGFGVMRYANPRYFHYLLRAFRSPSFSTQQLKDQIGTAVLPNLLMNLFFAASAGIYLYFIFKLNMPQRYAIYSPSLIIGIFILSLLLLYLGKHIVMLFSGWVFNVHAVVSHYMYNVFLINKIIAIALLPFTIILAFAGNTLATPAMIVSLFLIGGLLVNRYIRSWQVLGPFFQYGKFHFFAYLCASELLPMALLTKLLIRGIYY